MTSNVGVAFSEAYGFEPWQVGLCFVSAVVGSLLGVFAGGHFSDWVADLLTRRHGGVRQPEMRLPAMAPCLVTAPLALLLYGAGIEYGLHWMCPTVGLGLCERSLPPSHSRLSLCGFGGPLTKNSEPFHCSGHKRLSSLCHRCIPARCRRGNVDGYRLQVCVKTRCCEGSLLCISPFESPILHGRNVPLTASAEMQHFLDFSSRFTQTPGSSSRVTWALTARWRALPPLSSLSGSRSTYGGTESDMRPGGGR